MVIPSAATPARRSLQLLLLLILILLLLPPLAPPQFLVILTSSLSGFRLPSEGSHGSKQSVITRTDVVWVECSRVTHYWFQPTIHVVRSAAAARSMYVGRYGGRWFAVSQLAVGKTPAARRAAGLLSLSKGPIKCLCFGEHPETTPDRPIFKPNTVSRRTYDTTSTSSDTATAIGTQRSKPVWQPLQPFSATSLLLP